MKSQKFYNTKLFRLLFTTKLGRNIVDTSFGWYEIKNWWSYSEVKKQRKDRTIIELIFYSMFFCLLFYLSFAPVKFKLVIWIMTFLMGIILVNETILYLIQQQVLYFVRKINALYLSNQTEVDVDAILSDGTVIDTNGEKYYNVKKDESVFLSNQNYIELFDNITENKPRKKEFLGYKLKVYPKSDEMTNNLSDDVMQFLNVRFGFENRFAPLQIKVYKMFAPKFRYKKDMGIYKDGKWINSSQVKEIDL